MSGDVQWTVGEDGYRAVGETVGKLPPGVYSIKQDGFGNIILVKEVMIDEAVLFDNPKSEMIEKHVKKFWSSEKRFKEHKVPHRCGVLLHGVPGTGKTKLLQSVGFKHVAQDGYVLLFPGRTDWFESAVKKLREVHPECRVLALIEDLHTHFEYSDETSSLTNLLDGAVSGGTSRNIVFLATTNYLDKLPLEVRNRPSRFDLVVELGPPDEGVRRAFFEAVTRNEFPIDLRRVVKDTDGMTLAHMMDVFTSVVIYEMEYEEVIERLVKMKDEKPKDNDDDD